jgi:thioredoxin 1
MRLRTRNVASTVLLLLLSCLITRAMSVTFDGVEKWNRALTPTGIGCLRDLYSTNPPAMFVMKGQKPSPDISPEIDFWEKMVATAVRDLDVQTVEQGDRRGLHLVTLSVALKVKTKDGLRARYVNEQQAWQQQSAGWRIVIAMHSDLGKMPPALHPNPNLYDRDADARADIAHALTVAKKEHRRVILLFGANWCYDCHVLDNAFHQLEVEALLRENFQLVHVDIGDDGKKNNDLAAQYQVPLERGIPALAVLDADGKLLFAQKNGEWESARSMDPDEIVAFLEKWKP